MITPETTPTLIPTNPATAPRNGDSEGVHQMRVGLRKLRAAISIFSGLFNDNQTSYIKAELVWMANELGPARDLDVYIRSTDEHLEKLRPKRRGLREFGDGLVSRRKAAFIKMKEAVASRDTGPSFSTLCSG